MKKLILILILLVVLLAGGTAVLAILKVGPFARLLQAVPLGDAEKGGAAAKPVDLPSSPTDAYYDVGSYIVPVIDNHMIVRQVGVDLAIAVDAKAATRVAAALPRLQDAFNTELFAIIPRYHDTKSSSDRQMIHDHLLRVAGRMFGDDAVHEVTIKSLYDR